MVSMYVFIGGALGALLRFLILRSFVGYPLNVLGVFLNNMIGCFLIGFISYLAIKKYNFFDDKFKKLLTVGFAGGFTTFSAFTQPVLEMFFKHHYVFAVLNLFASVISGLIFVSLGINCAYYLIVFLIRTRKLCRRN